MVEYRDSLEGLSEYDFEGFCIGWGRPLTGHELMRVLQVSHYVCVALRGGRVIGFVNAVSDGVFMAFIPLLEVRPDEQGQGIGSELVRRAIERYREFYGVDLLCDEGLVPFYTRLGMTQVTGMVSRNRSFHFDAGVPPASGPP